MTRDLRNLEQTLRAIDFINKQIEDWENVLEHVIPMNTFEEDAHDAYKNSWSRLLTLRHALEREKERLESS